MSEKTVFLHVGCGKTGSSALQNWLWSISSELAERGLYYPRVGEQAGSDGYRITTGNGVALYRGIRNGGGEELVHKHLASVDCDVLYSSETFQDLRVEEIRRLRHEVERGGARLCVIAFVRNVYDMAYSSYVQLVKRHLFTRSFRQYGQKMTMPQQFGVVRKFEEAGVPLVVRHYDDELRDGLDVALLSAVGRGVDGVPRMSGKKVNRSLSVYETEIMRLVNRVYLERLGGEGGRFCSEISDSFIYADPERESEIIYDEGLIEEFEGRFREQIEDLNSRYLQAGTLGVFDEKGKRCVEEIPKLDAAVGVLVQSLVTFKAEAEARKEGEAEALECGDERIPAVLRDEAVRREESRPQDALYLMGAAQVLRPNGPFINNRMRIYRRRFDVRAAGEKE